MPDDPESGVSGWTIDTVLAHVLRMLAEVDHRYEQRFVAQEKAAAIEIGAAKDAVAASFDAAHRAAAKAEAAAEKRADAANEFRGQLADQAATLMPRKESEQRIDALVEKIGDLDRRFSEAIGVNMSRIDRIEARSVGLTVGWGYLVGMIGLVSAVIAIAVALARLG